MKKSPYVILTLIVLLITAQLQAIPHLEKKGDATQLIVDGKPFLARGGELGNSAASNLDSLRPYWAELKEINLNTVVAPVYWDLIEPEEGNFDFSLVDGLIRDARANDMKLVLLWFGSWKNSMSCYTPPWVKTNIERFPRCETRDGEKLEILSPFDSTNMETDARAYRALMKHIREFDSKEQTVIIMQPENEIGMIIHARDYSSKATEMYHGEVPAELIQYLKTNRATLTVELTKAWSTSGYAEKGNWSEIFGDSPEAEEIFMAYYFAKYTDGVAAAGKAEYALPMYVNAALIRPGYKPGQHISAGPLPHLLDVWRAAAPALDFIAPDIYFPDFTNWTERYTRNGNPLFIPEALRSNVASVNALYAFAECDAIGFSPFGIETIENQPMNLLKGSYDILDQLEPLILEKQGTGEMRGFLQVSERQIAPTQIRLGGYEMNIAYEYALPPSLADGVINESGDKSPAGRLPAGGLVIQLAEDEFLFAGMGITITFDPLEPGKKAGIVEAEQGRFVDGVWKNEWWYSGDQTHQGRHIRLVPGAFSIQRVKLYKY